MAIVAIALNRVCAGQGHVHLDVSVDGGANREFMFHVDELREPLTAEEQATAIKGILQLRMKGKTRAQVRADLQAGFTVPV